MARPRFHLAFPVHDLEAARAFYAGVLGCATGRESEVWIDFDLMGHQVVAHLSPGDCTPVGAGGVDGQAIPVRHFGLIVDWDVFDELAARLKAAATPFIVEPYLRFAGSPGEQKTLFVADPSGNALEFKAFRDEAMIFATDGRLFA
ncbi:MAG: VOC family protein [Oceanicaulis sp.]|nr:VOC family protein [Oceanicaulis sp.]